MVKIGRNDLCSCGSGKKYKNCYLLNSTDCIVYKNENRTEYIEQHNKREKIVIEFLNEVIDETNIVFLSDKDEDRIPLRIQMIISFSLIDLFANYWYCYRNEGGKTNERAKNWYITYCMNNTNKYFIDNIQWKLLSVERLYEFRNSLVHFFGLSSIENNKVSIMLIPNDLPQHEYNEYERFFLEKNKETVMVRPHNFHKLIKEGAILMLNEWENLINKINNKQESEDVYIASIMRVYNKIMTEGASKIKLAKRK